MKMKKLLIVVPILFLFLASLFIYWRFNYPGEETVKQQVRERNPNAEVLSTELIFDWEPKRVVTYLVKYKEPASGEILSDEFSLKLHWNFQWQSCSDQTERKCD
jgi:hypothetical protein